MHSRLSIALLTLSAGVALPLASMLPASAATVKVGTIEYDVTTFLGSFDANTSLFQAVSPGKMPWWGDNTGDFAAEFARQVYDQLGNGPTQGFGPVFAFGKDTTSILGISQKLDDPQAQIDESIAMGAEVSYAIATPLWRDTTAVPAPLPVFGAIAAFGCSRQLRKRIKERQR